MRVAIVTETFPPEVNGVAGTLLHLARGLAARGDAVQVVRPRQRREEEVAAPELDHLLVGGWPIPLYRELRFGSYCPGRLIRDWRAVPPDVVHVATQGPLGLAASRAAERLGLPWTTTYHTRFESYGAYYGLAGLSTATGHYLRWFHNRALRTLVPTTLLAADLRQGGFERVAVVRRGVDLELFSPSRRSAEVRRGWGVSGDEPVVLYVGRLAPEKNLDLAVAAFRRIQRHRSNARMVVVGAGPELSRLGSANPDVLFTGTLRGGALAAAYASADLFVFPSLTETFGNVVVEAMASGLLVLAFHDAAAADLIACGDNGVTVDAGDERAFVRIAGNLARLPLAIWRNLGRQARCRAESETWVSVADDFARQLRGAAGQLTLPTAA